MVSRRYIPDATLVATALAGRIDKLENRLTETSTDVAALGRGIADITTQLRALATTPPPSSTPRQARDADEEADGQPDWFSIEDPEDALLVLEELTAWLTYRLTHCGFAPAPPCWPLHPAAVTDLLALTEEHAAAYAGPTPTPVSEWLTRWLPATRDRFIAELGPCLAERGHRSDGHVYDTTDFDPFSAAAWWATDRNTPAATAFGLIELA